MPADTTHKKKTISCCCPSPCGASPDPHSSCTQAGDEAVPKHMGWNWKHCSAERKGWRPGAIPRSIRELMCHFLRPCPCDTIPVGALTGKPPRDGPAPGPDPDADHQRPMIRVHRKNDEYTITMNPLKSAQELKVDPDPYLPCEPIHVRITANREDQRIAQIKQVIRNSGFRRCKCGQPVHQCTCRDNRELEALRECIDQCGMQFGIADLGTKLSLNRLKDLELDFTPPAAVAKSGLQPLPESDTRECQCNENDVLKELAAAAKAGGKAGKKGGAEEKGKR